MNVQLEVRGNQKEVCQSKEGSFGRMKPLFQNVQKVEGFGISGSLGPALVLLGQN